MNLIWGSLVKLKDPIKHDILFHVRFVHMGTHMPAWFRCRFVGDQTDFSESAIRLEMEKDCISILPFSQKDKIEMSWMELAI